MVKAVLASLSVTALLFGGAPAFAFGIQSIPTDLKLDDCTIVSSNDFETVWACPGYKGIPVMVKRSQVKATVSFGLTSTTEKAADQLLPPGFAPESSIEWRISNKDGDWKPFATILRYNADGKDGKTGAVLVVTQLKPGATCQIAYVDAVANADAATLAQQAADAHGFDFDCEKGTPEKVGKFAAW